MRILIGMEFSGVIRRAFAARGHEVWSCDFRPSEDNSPMHLMRDVFEVLHEMSFDLAIFHPECTYLCVSGLHWNIRRPERKTQTEKAMEDFMRCIEAPVERVAVENPIGCMSRVYRKPDQIIQPFEFGDDASKATCFWLKNLPPLLPTGLAQWRMVGTIPRQSNQTDSGQNRLTPGLRRAMERARTYPGIAQAMAVQWGETI